MQIFNDEMIENTTGTMGMDQISNDEVIEITTDWISFNHTLPPTGARPGGSLFSLAVIGILSVIAISFISIVVYAITKRAVCAIRRQENIPMEDVSKYHKLEGDDDDSVMVNVPVITNSVNVESVTEISTDIDEPPPPVDAYI